MTKKVFIIIVVFLIIIKGVKVVYDLYDKGYSHSGDVWQDTPEKALMQRADSTLETLQTLTPKTMLNTNYIDDIVKMAFVSVGDTLVTVTFVTNEKGQYSVLGYTEEVCLDSPAMFLMNGDPEQLNIDSDQSIMFPYNKYNTTVWGWCYTGYSFTVNGITPTKETYIFDCQGKTWSIDYWQIDNFPVETDVLIEYTEQQLY